MKELDFCTLSTFKGRTGLKAITSMTLYKLLWTVPFTEHFQTDFLADQMPILTSTFLLFPSLGHQFCRNNKTDQTRRSCITVKTLASRIWWSRKLSTVFPGNWSDGLWGNREFPIIWYDWKCVCTLSQTSEFAGPRDAVITQKIKESMHQGVAFNTLLFIIVMEKATKDWLSTVQWDKLYADDLVISAEPISQSFEKLNTWTKLHKNQV